MKVIIAGSRGITLDVNEVQELVNYSGFEVTEVVCGKARGMDQSGEDWALDKDIPVKEFPADWDTHGKAAGHIRNAEMADYADALILVWDGSSRGSKGMLDKAKTKLLNVYEHVIT